MLNDGAGRRPRSFKVKGEFLRNLRLEQQWSQEEAAAKAGYTERLIRKAESNGPLQLSTIADLAELYSTPDRQLTIDDLVNVARNSTAGDCSDSRDAVAMVRRWFDELWNQRRLDVVDELAAPDGVLYAEGREFRGREALRRRAAEVHAACSDIRMEIIEISAHGDVVSCRWRATFLHTGEWLGQPPSNKRLLVNASTWIRVPGRWFTEGWDYWQVQLDDVIARAGE